MFWWKVYSSRDHLETKDFQWFIIYLDFVAGNSVFCFFYFLHRKRFLTYSPAESHFNSIM